MCGTDTRRRAQHWQSAINGIILRPMLTARNAFIYKVPISRAEYYIPISIYILFFFISFLPFFYLQLKCAVSIALLGPFENPSTLELFDALRRTKNVLYECSRVNRRELILLVYHTYGGHIEWNVAARFCQTSCPWRSSNGDMGA